MIVEFIEVIFSRFIDLIEHAHVLAGARQVAVLVAVQLTLLYKQLLVHLAVLLKLLDEATDPCTTTTQ